jgi:ABC-type branched-subunit amino acid transport system ATPase component
MTDLVKRLRDWIHVYPEDYDKDAGHLYEEAAARIEELEAEVERVLETANCLESVADCVSIRLDSPEQGVSFELARDLSNALTAFRAAREGEE